MGPWEAVMKSYQALIHFTKICVPILLLGCSASQQLVAQTGTFLDRYLPTDIRVVSYNIYLNSFISDPIQADKFVRVVDALDPDILNLQEVNSSAAQVKGLLDNIAPLGGAGWYTYKGRGTVIASKYPLSMLHSSIDSTSDRPPAIALVDLPDSLYGTDFYIVNHHFHPSSAAPAPENRQKSADATVRWLQDARTSGGVVDLPPGTPIAVLGDMNTFPEQTSVNRMIEGDIFYEDLYGPDSPPDWDGTSFTNAHPTINGTGIGDYTYRWATSRTRIDHITYSDSALDIANKFILNTFEMSPADLAATGLQPLDVTIDQEGVIFDHLPLVADFRVFEFANSDFNFSRSVGSDDLAIWQAGYSAAGSSRMEGDADGDGDVDGRDFLIWQQSMPTTEGPLSLYAAVPEPSTLLLGASFLGLSCCGCVRRTAC
jgi:endonuclease/exonuclease/phosphatase family metal-dependent hydrolase